MEYPRAYGEYVLLERLGSGGMSDVDLAKKAIEETGFERFVVIKRVKADRVADDSFIRMFKDEARITSQLNHTNIAQTYDFGRVGDEYFLVLEYVPGIDIRGIINTLRERDQRVPLRVVLYIIHEVLQGLEYAHEMVDIRGNSMDIVHRDVNPRNIMVSIRGDVKLIDFGVAKATDRLERTRTDHVKGKFRYMSPEQITGKTIDHRADLFAVGLTFHELLSGYSPYVGLTQIQIMHKLVSGDVPDLPPISELRDTSEVERIHRKALHPKLELRYRDAAEFRADIAALANQVGGLPKPAQVVQFLQHVDERLERRIQGKVDEYSGPIQVDFSEDPETSISDLRPAVPYSDAEMSETLKAIVELQRANSESASKRVGFILLGSFIMTCTILLILGAVGYYALNFIGLPVGPSPVPVEQGVAPVNPSSGSGPAHPQPEAELKPATPTPALASEPKPVAPTAPPPSKQVATTPSAPEVAPTAEEPVEVQVAPAPVKPSLPAEVTSPAPSEPLRDEPREQITFGMLQVTSTEKGRPITINGTKTKYSTPARFEWPVGEAEVVVEGYPSKQVFVRESQVNNVLFR